MIFAVSASAFCKRVPPGTRFEVSIASGSPVYSAFVKYGVYGSPAACGAMKIGPGNALLLCFARALLLRLLLDDDLGIGSFLFYLLGRTFDLRHRLSALLRFSSFDALNGLATVLSFDRLLSEIGSGL